jgi:peptidoglycan/xylan/chitin deacetylase (PgdA/CDA1 family)
MWPWSIAAGITVLFVAHALVVYATLRPNVQWLGPVVTHFATEKNEVWLTIDDGPSDDTQAVLSLFAQFGARATFFVKGSLASEHADRMRSIVDGGHTVANHSHTHPAGSFWCSPPSRIARQIDACNDAIAGITGERPRWFRAPVGMKNPFVHPILERRGMRLIGWTSRGFDGVVGDPERVWRSIEKTLRPGAIVLVHQGSHYSLGVLERVVKGLKAKGYSFAIPEDSQLR